MAQDHRPSTGALQSNASPDRRTGKSDGSENDRVTMADFGANHGADFQISLATATSIASLTAYATPVASKAHYVSDEDIAAATTQPLSYQPSDRALVDAAREETAPSQSASAPGSSKSPAKEGAPETPPLETPGAPELAASPVTASHETTATTEPQGTSEIVSPAVTTSGSAGPASEPDAPHLVQTWSPDDELEGDITENSPSGTEAAILPPLDQYGAAITYQITDSTGSPLTGSGFELDGNRIILSPGTSIDYETTPELTLYVTATNAGGTSGPWEVTLAVGDEAEAITLGDGSESFTDTGIAETSITGGAGDDTITGHDDGSTISGGAGGDSLTGGSSDDSFIGGAGDDTVDGGAGADTAVFTGSWADYTITEAGGTYTVIDNRPGSPDGTDTLTNVEIFRFADGDVSPADALNDGPTLSVADGTVSENDAGAIVGAVSASDPDAGDTVTLSVDDARFEIVGGQLKLRDGVSLDHEAGETVAVTVTATDSHGATDTQVVSITVGDVNEGPSLTAADGMIAENDAGAVVGAVAATDPDDGDTLTYSVDDARFEVVGGQLKLKDGISLDHEAGDTVAVTVTVTDSAGATDTQVVTVTVGDVNEGPSLITADGTVAENDAGAVVGSVSATDPDDGDTLTYSVDDARFEVVGGQLRLKDGVSLDHEAGESVAVMVTVTDSAGATDTQVVTVTVGDVNEGPVLTAVDGSVAENDTGAVIGAVAATDPDDGDTLTYSVDDARFEVVGGQLKLKDGISLDHEAGETVAVTVTVTDSAGASDTQVVTVTVGDVNEGPNLTAADGGVAENDAGAIVGAVSAIDPDDGDILTYSVDDARFEVVGGQLKLKDGVSLDHEAGDTVAVTVTVTDGAGATDTQVVTVTVGDVNEGPDLTAADGSVTENVAGALVGAVSATDPDDGDTLTYSVDDARFEVVGGQLKLKDGESLDFEDSDTVSVTVSVTDSAGASDVEIVTITVGDEAEAITLGNGGEAFTDTSVAETSITGGSGDDTITAHGDGGNLDGGAGADALHGGGGQDTLAGGDGADTLVAGGDDDVLAGGSGDDALSGDMGSDSLEGGSGDDAIDGGAGTDTATWDGDLADFSVVYDAGTGTFTIADQNATNGDEGTDTVTGIETFVFNGTSYTLPEMITEADRQANSGPGAPSLASGGDVDENSAANTVVATLTATDADGDTLTYRITDASGTPVSDSNFEIVGNEIRVRSGADLNYEASPTHDLYVTASDTYETSPPTAISITVNDVAEGIALGDGGESFTDTGVAETSVTGGAGADTISAHDDGADLSGGAGDDQLGGGAGDDSLVGDAGDDRVTGGDGADTLEGGDGADTLLGGAGADNLDGGSDSDSIDGGAGDDTILGGAGNDTLDGGAGSDIAIFTGNWADYTITEAGGTFTLVDNRPGSPDGTDTVTNVEVLRFADGDLSPADALNDGPTVTAVDGSVTENDAGAVVGAVNATDPDAGDTVTLSVDDARFEIVGGQLKLKDGVSLDYEDGTTLSVTVTATDAHGATDTEVVTVTVGDEAEAITLGDGGEAFTDTGVAEISITGGTGDDTIVGHGGGGDIDGGVGADQITGGGSGDTLTGGTDDDTLTGGAGDDGLDGGTGTDTATWSGDLSDFSVAYDAGSDTFTISDQNAGDGDEGTDTVTNVETFVFNGVTYTHQDLIDEAALQANTAPTDITMTGGAVNETVSDGGTIAAAYDPSGSTVATLSATDDNGDSHSYTLVSDPSGHFEIVGNEIRVRSGQVIDHETAASHDVTVRVTDQHGATYDEVLTLTVTDFEGSYTAGNGGEVVAGTSEEDAITGGSGADSIQGGAGDDTILGGSGADTLVAGAGDDSLSGGDGADSLHAGSGSDTLQGGAGDDTFHVDETDGASTLSGGTGSDRISVDGAGGFSATFTGDDAGTLTANSGTATASFDGVEAIGGGEGDDHLDASASTQSVTLTAGDGDDTLVGGSGDDTLLAGAGADQLDGGAGDDVLGLDQGDGSATLAGGAGTDTLDLGGSGGFDVTFSGDGAGTATARGGSASGTFSDLEAIGGSEGDDALDASADTSGVALDGDAGADTITGGQGDDSLTGGAGDDTFVVNDTFGDDTIAGGADRDVIDLSAVTVPVTVTFTGTGAGTISDGTNTITFTGIERLILTDQADVVDASADGAGVDIDTRNGGDHVQGSGADDTLRGGAGNDTVYSGIGDDHVEGGAGADRIAGEIGDDTLVGGAGADTIEAGEGADSVEGGDGDDVITGYNAWGAMSGSTDVWADDGSADTLSGGTGADTIAGGQGADVLSGGDDADTFVIHDSFGNDTISGGEGGTDSDTIDLSAVTIPVTVTFTGTGEGTISDGTSTLAFTGIERLILTDSADLVDATADAGGIEIIAADGNDTIYGGSGSDNIDGGAGDDRLEGNGGDDTLEGGGGSDTLYAGAGDDSLAGGDGDDTLHAGTGNDTIDGGAGDDLLDIDDDDGTVTVVGGAGNDTLDVDSASTSDGFNVTFTGDDAGTFNATSGTASGTFTEIENVEGTGNDDTIDGSASSSGVGITGLSGDDSLTGGAGDDTISGGDDDDTISGGGGADSLSGGSGADEFTITDGFGSDTITGGEAGSDADVLDLTGLSSGATITLTGDEAGTVTDGSDTLAFSEIEDIRGTGHDDFIDGSAAADGMGNVASGAGDDTLIGTTGWDDLRGGEGDDSILGGDGGGNLESGAGHDTVTGGSGSDDIYGGTGDDSLSGLDGDDVISAGSGADTIAGGAGDDDIDVDSDSDTDTIVLENGGGHDTIRGFDGPVDTGGGVYTSEDVLDVSGLTNAHGNRVTVTDVTVTDTNGDGTGDAVLTFPGGESVTLEGVLASDVSSENQLTALGIPPAHTHEDLSQLIFLGNFAELDTDESTSGYEGSTAPIIGTTLAGAAANANIVDFSYNDADGDGTLEANHEGAGENLTVGGTSSAIDDIVMVSVELTFLDGSTSSTTVIGYQLENGDFYLGDFADRIDGQTVTSLEVTGISDTSDTVSLSGFQGGGTYDLDNFGFVDPLDHVVEGTSGDDVIDTSYTGDPEGDRIDSNDHSDGSNDDVVAAGAGDDTITGGAGDDALDGGAGTDVAVFTGAWADYTITEAGGTYTITDNRPGSPDGTDTVTNIEVLRFSDGDVAPADALNDGPTVTAADGSVIENDAGAVVGVVSASDPDAGDTVTLSVDDARFEIVGGQLKLKDGVSLDYEDGNTVSVTVTATDVHGATDTQVVTVTVGDTAEAITLGNGGEAFTDTGVAETSITGGNGDDTINGHADGSTIDGGAGDDQITGAAGADTLTGGAGDDTLAGGTGSDIATFTGNWADYTITEAGGTYTVTDNRPGSPDGTDTLTGIETLRFADGDVTPADALNDGPSVTATDGTVTENNAGAVVGAVSASDPDAGDTVTLSVDDARFEIVGGQLKLKDGFSLDYEDGNTVSVNVTATDAHGATDTQVVTVTVGDTAEAITLGNGGETFTDTGVAETSITGGTGDDTITGHAGGSTIDGGAGDDVITGSDTDDVLAGGAGDDTITTGLGGDSVDGGEGSDTILVHNWSGGTDNHITDSGTTGTDRIVLVGSDNSGFEISSDLTGIEIIDGSGVTGEALESINGSNYDLSGITLIDVDEIRGNGSDETIIGSAGDDNIVAGGGQDTVSGGAGDDTLEGGTGNDNLSGGTGDDTIDGGDGSDTATWDGDFADFAVSYDSGSDTFTITDLNAADGDEGGDTVTGIETFVFNGVSYSHADMVAEADAQADAVPTDMEFERSDSLTHESPTATFSGQSHHFDLEGNASDSTGSNHGTVHGGTTIAGRDGNALEFDEVNDYVTVPDVTMNSDFTVTFQFRLDDNSGSVFQYMYSHGDINGANSLNVFIGESGHSSVPNLLRTVIRDENDSLDNSALDVDISGIVGDGEWHTYTLTVENGVGSSVYLDGVLQNTDTRGGDNFNPSGDVFLGGREDLNADRFFGGALDTVQIYDRPLTSSEITELSGNSTDEYVAAGSVVASVSNVVTAGTPGANTFSLVDDAGGVFQINPTNGDVTLVADLDLDATFSDTVTVRVTNEHGASYDETLEIVLGAGSTDDAIAASGAQGIIYGFGGDDTIEGGGGDDILDGGEGSDTAEWSGDLSDYAFSYDSATGTLTVSDQNAADGDEGTDLVTGVETYVFNGVSYTHTDMVAFATGTPTDISIAAVHDLDASPGTPDQTVVTGRIVESDDDSSVDHWEIAHGGGDLVIDVLANGFNGGSLDSQMYLYRDNGDGSFTLVASNDDGAAGEDGSTSNRDSYIAESGLASGTYVLAVGSYPLGSSEAISTSGNYPNEDSDSSGPYQVTFTGEATVTFATNPSGGGAWGDVGGDATVVSTTPGISSGLTAGTIVADVTGVTDSDAGDSHSFSLTDDAGGDFAIDSTTGEISVTGDPRAGNTYQDTITIRTTDGAGNTHDETLGLTFGTDGDDTLTGTSGDDIIYAVDGTNVINGGAGDDTIVGGVSTSSTAASWQSFAGGANLHGTDGQDFFTWSPGSSDSATIRFENTTDAGDGDGIADYVRVESTADGTWLQIGDFDLGVDQIVLPEAYTGVSTSTNSGYVDYTITYANGNQQTYRLHHSGGSTDPAGVFTTVEPTLPAATGADRAVYSGDQSDFDISYNAATGTYTITDTDTADGLDEGTDVLSGVETFTFDGVNVAASDFQGESSVAAGSFDYDSGTSGDHPTATFAGTSGQDSHSDTGSTDQTVYARAGNDSITTGAGDDAVYGGSGDDTISAGSGDDTLYGGTGDDSLVGGDGNDSFYFTSMQGDDTVAGGAGWTDIIELAGFGGDVTVDGNTIDGEGWTMVLDGGYEVTGQTLDSIELTADASGVITFDEGGTIDFSGIERIGF